MSRVSQLRALLLSSGIRKDNPTLFQVIDQIIKSLDSEIQTTVASSGATSVDLSSVKNRNYATYTDETAILPNSLNVRDIGYWTSLVLSNNSNSRLGTFVEDDNLVGELVLTDNGDPIAVWGSTYG